MYRYFLQDNYSNVKIGFEEDNKMHAVSFDSSKSMDIIISETERTELFIVLIVHILALREVKLCVFK